jgi:hypothetical protein
MGQPGKETAIFANSSHIAEAEYERDTKTLTVTFQDGSTFAYRGVPVEVWGGMQTTPSVGSFFHRQIKGRYSHEDMR